MLRLQNCSTWLVFAGQGMSWGGDRLALLIHAPNCLVWAVRRSEICRFTCQIRLEELAYDPRRYGIQWKQQRRETARSSSGSFGVGWVGRQSSKACMWLHRASSPVAPSLDGPGAQTMYRVHREMALRCQVLPFFDQFERRVDYWNPGLKRKVSLLKK